MVNYKSIRSIKFIKTQPYSSITNKRKDNYFMIINIENLKEKNNRGITLIALVITILFSYDEKIKCSNSKGFLLTTI